MPVRAPRSPRKPPTPAASSSPAAVPAPKPDWSAVAHDGQLRALLKTHLRTLPGADKTLVVDELDLAYGTVRADLAVIGERLEGFEVKAAHDVLTRLPKQMQAYDATFERCWLVTVEPHLAKALALVPSWWGVLVADAQATLRVHRDAGDNPLQDALHVAKLLWRDEALAKLDAIGKLAGFKTKPKLALFARLRDNLALPELTAYVCEALRARPDWRDENGNSVLASRTRAKTGATA